jgi:hypothetical protein
LNVTAPSTGFGIVVPSNGALAIVVPANSPPSAD